MDWPSGRPIVRTGTPPTPEDPAPSNQVVEEYPDGRTIVRTGNPDQKVLNEYREALSRHPEDGGLRYYYAMSLKAAGDMDGALREMREAVRITPTDHHYKMSLAFLLNEADQPQEALAAVTDVLRRFEDASPADNGQSEALARWGASEILSKLGRSAEAGEELRRAVEAQRSAVAAGAGSPQLLRQLQDLLSSGN